LGNGFRILGDHRGEIIWIPHDHAGIVDLPEEVLLFLRQDHVGALSQVNKIVRGGSFCVSSVTNAFKAFSNAI
jgi:hypothetical protein